MSTEILSGSFQHQIKSCCKILVKDQAATLVTEVSCLEQRGEKFKNKYHPLCIQNQIVLFYPLKQDLVMKDIIYIILAIIIAGLTFAFMVKKMKDDCIP